MKRLLTERLQGLAPEQQRRQTAIAADLAKHGLDQHDAQALSLDVAELAPQYPKLSQKDIDQIADAVSKKFIQNWGNSLKPKEREGFQGKLAKIAGEIAIGIASSAIYELLVYLFYAGVFLFESAQVDLKAEAERTRTLSKLTKEMSPEARNQLTENLPTLMSVQIRFFLKREQALKTDQVMMSLLDKLEPHYSGPLDQQLCNSLLKSVYSELVRTTETRIQ